ncbi:GNAT family N-acetyltransferase [Bacillus sp. FJAT-49736]|uniref:GNAT family N-acetyltransferase n=1 Tax=Bacillus sp. FJAT-49736 TaxID=2833582 RepID=UPI001BCA1E6C|nr:GNAT family N-acetyltransferase [Bacillus sp. FJAT-49736]MBS4172168.1 GNAT family N-acetyltransferase [Bacillus sp. FJAT-49736]
MMKNIEIKPITQKNIRECAKLEVSEDQKQFVARNLATIAWAYVDPQFTPYAICDGETVVGVAAVEYIPDNEDYDRHWVPRFMIGEQFQGKGYGKQGMLKVIEMITKQHSSCQRVRLSVVPENQGAINFYKNIGFMETDETLEDENVMDFFIKNDIVNV